MPQIEIRRIGYGEKITSPGIYEMPLEWHHSDCCDGPSVTSTNLRKMELETPQHMYDSWSGNPDRDPDAGKKLLEADYFRFGRAAHLKVLEPQLYKDRIAVRPDIYDSWRTKDAKKWLADIEAMHQYTVLTPDEEARVMGAVRAINANPAFSEGILGGMVEASMVWRDKRTGIWIKSRPDSIPNQAAMTDLKFMDDASPRAVDRAIRTLGYDMQLALGGIGFFKLTGVTIDTFFLMAVESKRPHAIHIPTLSTNAVYWSRVRIRRALDRIAKCLQDNYWPAYEADGQPAGEPYATQVTEWEAMQKAGMMPEDTFVEDEADGPDAD